MKNTEDVKYSKRNLRCNLTRDELLTAGKDLADKTGALARLEEDKKRVVADFSAKISGIEADISIISNKISSGYDYRDVQCTEYLESPGPGKKTVVRDDTSETVGVEDMTVAEMQRELIK